MLTLIFKNSRQEEFSVQITTFSPGFVLGTLSYSDNPYFSSLNQLPFDIGEIVYRNHPYIVTNIHQVKTPEYTLVQFVFQSPESVENQQRNPEYTFTQTDCDISDLSGTTAEINAFSQFLAEQYIKVTKVNPNL